MYVTIHGHFYQPPRENPWTGVVPRHDTGTSARNWNVRITEECYRANGWSRVLGPGNLIEDIVDNYAYINFDFGPTLLTWLDANAPDGYRRILEADGLSQSLQKGHGNAIAQVYNHMIMPLANHRDKRTQIVWGLRDFEFRFGRKSESIWLAETAVNLETIKILIEYGIRYIILSPFQSLRVRPLDRSRGWTDARGGKIDPRRAYRFFLKDARRRRIPDRSVDVFFYDGPLAADVSFSHLLRSASVLRERIVQAGEGVGDGGLVSVATDGEVYGHHERFGDMGLAYLIRREAPSHGLEFVNYGHYLDLHPPQWEVDLNFGEHDEGTAWSCAHGVGRWERDCGCSTGGDPGWQQRWRTPMRRGFDMIRNRLVETYLEQVSPLVKDAWAARDDYINVLLDTTPLARDVFVEEHAKKHLTDGERGKLWSLLESQRYAMFMYASCGWFFEDISRIEAIQNMTCASRAIELAQPYQSLDLERMLLEYLGEAWSNRPEMGNGADIYRRFVNPQRISAQRVAGDLALAAAVLGEEPESREFRYAVITHEFWESGERDREGDGVSRHGLLELVDQDTEERFAFEVHVYHSHLWDVRCYVLPARRQEGEALPERVRRAAPEEEISRAEGAARFSLSDLVAENRERIIRKAYESILEREDHSLSELFEESRDLMGTFRRAQVPIPLVFQAVATHVLGRMLQAVAGRLRACLERNLDAEAPPEAGETEEILSETAKLLEFARESELEVDVGSLKSAFSSVLEALLGKLLQGPDPLWAGRFVAVIRNRDPLNFPLDLRPLEDVAFLVLRKHRTVLLSYADTPSEGQRLKWAPFEALAEALRLNLRCILEMPEEDHTAPSEPLGTRSGDET